MTAPNGANVTSWPCISSRKVPASSNGSEHPDNQTDSLRTSGNVLPYGMAVATALESAPLVPTYELWVFALCPVYQGSSVSCT